MLQFDFHFDFSKFKEIIKIGVPSGVQSILVNMSGVVVQSSINSFGPEAVSGNGIANSIINYAGMMLAGLYGATTTFVAQNFTFSRYTDQLKSDKVENAQNISTFGSIFLLISSARRHL